jgi:hypothetical protein
MSALFSSLKEPISTSQRYELVPDLSDHGKMDAVVGPVFGSPVLSGETQANLVKALRVRIDNGDEAPKLIDLMTVDAL